MKKVFIKTYGCQMNVRDSEAVTALLRNRGYGIATQETDADIILLNTCSVRDLAEQKSIGKMTGLAHAKKYKPGLILGYMGCMAQSRGAELLKLPAVNLVVGTQKFHHLPDYLDKLTGRASGPAPAASEETPRRGRDTAPYPATSPVGSAHRADQIPTNGTARPAVAPYQILDIADEAGSESAVKHHEPGKVTAYVSIMQGCDMHCTFCIVPATRGQERSRGIPEIVDEIEKLVATGVREVTLLGQIVTSYGQKKSEFVKLLTAVNAIPGLERIRFTSPHPQGFGDDLVGAYQNLEKLCEHAHLPAQSGSDRILQSMHRGYNRAKYLRIIEKLRAARPGIALTTDIIVGFPGETDEDFAATAALLEEVQFDQGYIFKYSKRRDTPAAILPDQLPETVKEARNQAALSIVNAAAVSHNNRLIGQSVEILVDGRSTKGAKRMLGRTRTNKIVIFDGQERQAGQLLPIKIERATTVALYGTE